MKSVHCIEDLRQLARFRFTKFRPLAPFRRRYKVYFAEDDGVYIGDVMGNPGEWYSWDFGMNGDTQKRGPFTSRLDAVRAMVPEKGGESIDARS